MDNVMKFKILTMYDHGKRSYSEIAKISGAKFSEVRKIIEEERENMAISSEKRKEVIRLLDEGMTIRRIEEETGISHGTISRIKAELNAVINIPETAADVEAPVETVESFEQEEHAEEIAEEHAEEPQKPEPVIQAEEADGVEYTRLIPPQPAPEEEEPEEEEDAELIESNQVINGCLAGILNKKAEKTSSHINRMISKIWKDLMKLESIESAFAADGQFDDAHGIRERIDTVVSTLYELCERT